jgi:Tol biopolymer transport system component
LTKNLHTLNKSRKTYRLVALLCSLIYLLILLSGCNSQTEKNRAEIPPAITENTKTPTTTSIPTITPSPEPTVDYVPLIQSINQNVLVYQDVYKDGINYIQFSSLDFPAFDGTGADIRKVYYELPLPINESNDIWNITFINNHQSFIYSAYNENRNQANIYKFNTYTGLSEQITFNKAYFSDLSSTESKISYKTTNNAVYIVDLSGYGNQYTQNMSIYSKILFSPDEKSIAFIAQTNEDEDFHLFVGSLSDPGNLIQITSDPVKHWFHGTRMDDLYFVWSPDSKSIVYKKIYFPMMDSNLCTIDIESREETCLLEYKFVDIQTFEFSADNLLVLSGMEEYDYKRTCIPCSVEDYNHNLYLLDFNTGQKSIIADNRYSELEPMWIENGQYILYQYYENYVTQIYITDKTGSFHQPLTNSRMDTNLLN